MHSASAESKNVGAAVTGEPTRDESAVRPHGHLRRISLIPFVAVLYAYCAGGPFGFEAMISTSGPGLALIFILVVPFLFSVPVALATAELSSAMPVEGGFYRWTNAALGRFWGFQCGWWNWTGTFLMSAAYGVMLADYVGHVIPLRSPLLHWLIAVAFLGMVAFLNIRGIQLVGKLTLVLLLLALIPVAVFTYYGFSHSQFHPFEPLMPPDKSWREVFGVGLALALWIYSGYEQMSTVSEELEQPKRNFPSGSRHRRSARDHHILSPNGRSSSRRWSMAKLGYRFYGHSSTAAWGNTLGSCHACRRPRLYFRSARKYRSFGNSTPFHHGGRWLPSSFTRRTERALRNSGQVDSALGSTMLNTCSGKPDAADRDLCLVPCFHLGVNFSFIMETALSEARYAEAVQSPRGAARLGSYRPHAHHPVYVGSLQQ
jgi:hypothetical protein